MNQTNTERDFSLFYSYRILDSIYYVLNALLLAVQVVLWFIFCKEQPLRSRLLSPLLYLLLMFTYHFAQAIIYITETAYKGAAADLTKHNYEFETAKTVMYSWLTFTCCFCITTFFLQAIRYISWQNLHSVQMKFLAHASRQSVDGSVNLQQLLKEELLKTRIYKVASSKITSYVAITITAVVMFIICSITTGVMIGMKVQRTPPWPEDIIAVVVAVLALLGSFVIFSYDAIANRSICCKCAQFFCKTERMFFRVDMIILYFAYACYIANLILTQVTSALQDLPQKLTAEPIVSYLFSDIFAMFFMMLLHTGFGGGTCIIICLYRRMQGCSSKGSNNSGITNEALAACLADHNGYDLFKSYVESEYSTENLACWTLIQKYRKTKDSARRTRISQDMVATFVKERSPLEVNTTAEVRTLTMKAVEDCATNQELLVDTLFDRLELEVSVNLLDSYQRFVKSIEYRQFQRMKRDEQDELKKISKGFVV